MTLVVKCDGCGKVAEIGAATGGDIPVYLKTPAEEVIRVTSNMNGDLRFVWRIDNGHLCAKCRYAAVTYMFRTEV